MKKKIFCIALAASLLVAAGGLCLLLSGNEFTVARCIVTDGGGVYMVHHDCPVLLTSLGDRDFQTGDKLLVLHANVFADSYPQQARTVFILRIGRGSRADIPESALKIFTELEYSIKE